MNLPNRLTVIRMVLVPFVVLCMLPIPGLGCWNDFVASQSGHIVACLLYTSDAADE